MLHDRGIYYFDGINYSSPKDGWYEPSLTLNLSGKDIKVKYANPQLRPWRELQALLNFLSAQGSSSYESFFVNKGIDRARQIGCSLAIWSAGLKVSPKNGDQSVKKSDDFVESIVWLNPNQLGEVWFTHLKQEMEALDQLAKKLYGSVSSYFREQKVDGTKLAAQATEIFWQLCERDFQALVEGCDNDEQRQALRRRFAGYLRQSYDRFCPHSTARQLDAWAKCRPNLSGYQPLKQEA